MQGLEEVAASTSQAEKIARVKSEAAEAVAAQATEKAKAGADNMKAAIELGASDESISSLVPRAEQWTVSDVEMWSPRQRENAKPVVRIMVIQMFALHNLRRNKLN